MYAAGQTSVDAGAPWPTGPPYMLQMVQVPMMSAPTAGFNHAHALDPRSLAAIGVAQPFFAPMQADAGHHSVGFKYPSESVVMAVGQYREIRPQVAPALLAGCVHRFHVEPAELPAGLQLDPLTGAIWGTPLPPPHEADPAGPYSTHTVVLSGPTGSVSASIKIKVVHFQPSSFKVSHVSQLERNKYMVLVDTRRR